MPKETPWEQINIPKQDYNVRRVSESGSVPLLWGRDSAGHYLFVVELKGDHTKQFCRDGTSVRGINVDLRRLDSDTKQGLVLTLESQANRDLFQGLCETMIASLKDIENDATALSVSLAHIKRWKAFLAGKKNRLLSPEEIRGLYGELLFLKFLFDDKLDQRSAVDAWVGPEGGHQDFIFQNSAAEIKALSGRERSTVRISSEDQLEALCDNLYLVIYRLSELPESGYALSLNGLVRSIESELKDAETVDLFLQKLSAYGYVEMLEYDKPEFVKSAFHAFKVCEEFPRLMRSGIPDGIVRLSYELELEKLGTFECSPVEIGGK